MFLFNSSPMSMVSMCIYFHSPLIPTSCPSFTAHSFPLPCPSTLLPSPLTLPPDPTVLSRLHSIVEPFLLRRVKSVVIVDLPVKSEVILFTGLSAMQKKYYKAILTKDLSRSVDNVLYIQDRRWILMHEKFEMSHCQGVSLPVNTSVYC